MKQIKISSAYIKHASVERYKKTPERRSICVPITTGLGFSCVITENIGKSEHSALLGFHIAGDHPQMPKTELHCRRKITQAELDSIIGALAKTDTNYLKDAIAGMFWLPPELQASAKPVEQKPVSIKSKVQDFFKQPDLFAIV